MSEVTRILQSIERGDANATEGLLPLVYCPSSFEIIPPSPPSTGSISINFFPGAAGTGFVSGPEAAHGAALDFAVSGGRFSGDAAISAGSLSGSSWSCALGMYQFVRLSIQAR